MLVVALREKGVPICTEVFRIWEVFLRDSKTRRGDYAVQKT
jgi:hypothetical protein